SRAPPARTRCRPRPPPRARPRPGRPRPPRTRRRRRTSRTRPSAWSSRLTTFRLEDPNGLGRLTGGRAGCGLCGTDRNDSDAHTAARSRLEPQRAERANPLGHLVAHPLNLVALGGGDPLEPNPSLLDSEVAQHAPQELEAPERVDVPLLVVAVPRMAAPDQHAVGSVPERGEDELRVDPARAHEPDGPDVWRVLHPRDPGEVGGRVRAPGAEERHDPGLEGAVGLRHTPAPPRSPRGSARR